MKKYKNDPSLKALFTVAIFAIGFYLISMFTLIGLCKLYFTNKANKQNETYMFVGYDQGRRQVLDSLNIVRNETKKFENTRKKAVGFHANGSFHRTNAHR